MRFPDGIERSIIHINVADFAVAVERQADRRLCRRPVIIAPEGSSRAFVYDMSEEAYQEGVRKNMPLKDAVKRCRNAAVLPPHYDRYEQAATRLVKIALPYSPLIEAVDHKGHLFVDVTGTGRLFGPPPDIAWRIRKQVRADTGVDPVWSVAPNKLVAKAASRLVKPKGEYIVGAGEEEAFLAPLPLRLIPGIGRDSLARLYEFNMTRAGHVVPLSSEQIAVILGKAGRHVYEAVRGTDPSPVLPVGAEPAAVKKAHEFGEHTNERAVVERVLYELIESAGAELRRRRLAARRITVGLSYADGTEVFRRAVLRPAAAVDGRLFSSAQTALYQAWKRRIRIRRISANCDHCAPLQIQSSLFDDERKKEEKETRLMGVLDTVRRRFGDHALCMGRTL